MMKNYKNKIVAIASCLLIASLCMPVSTHAEEVQDNAIGVTDAVVLQKYLHGKQTITEEQFIKLDRNHDNLVNIYDFVLLKKELISDSSENTSQLQAKTRIDTTRAVNYSAWKVATSNESYVIKSVQELDEIVTPLFQEGVIRSLETTYDDKFFEDNILLLDLEPLESDTKFTLEIADCAYNAENQLEVLYQRTPVNAYSGQKIAIGQVAIPKNQYYDNEVIWNSKYSDAKDINKPIAFESKTDEISWHIKDDYNGYDVQENVLITTQEELTDFLANILDEEYLAEYQEVYSDDFFESKSLYLHMSNMDCGDDNTWRVTETVMQDDSKHINIDFKNYGSGGCIIGCYLNQVIIDKVDKDCIVDETNVVLYSRNSFDGTRYYYDLPETYLESKDCKAIAVNIYEFAGNKEIAIYKYKIDDWGVVWNGNFKLLGSFAYTGDETTFTQDYETDENNNFIGEDFLISYDEEKIVINYTGAENPIEVAWN
ncbi:MAG: dockerin type I repeat-containing protein [Oscillospiraceae bacterium]|nr:dockerin type I repeat-containing protein [Oscillospiraceae bacterium]